MKGPAAIAPDRETLEQLAELVADALDARDRHRRGWVDAATVADYLQVDAEWVRDNAARLGAVRLGEGDRPRLRFRLATVDEALTGGHTGGASFPEGRRPGVPGSGVVERNRRRRRQGLSGTGAELLPIRGSI